MENLATLWKVRGKGYSQEYSALDTAIFHALRVSEAMNQPMDIFETNWMNGSSFKVRSINPDDFTILRRKQGFREPPKAPPVPPRPKTPYEQSLVALGLSEPFSKADLRSAYRQKAKTAHPDQGGSKSAFQALTDHYDLIVKTKRYH